MIKPNISLTALVASVPALWGGYKAIKNVLDGKKVPDDAKAIVEGAIAIGSIAFGREFITENARFIDMAEAGLVAAVEAGQASPADLVEMRKWVEVNRTMVQALIDNGEKVRASVDEMSDAAVIGLVTEGV